AGIRPSRWDPVERSEASGYGPVGRKHDGGIELRDRVNATTTDSGVGEAVEASPTEGA
ncbi:unnamed protein product, partial [marine sediment metagenome]